MPKKSKNWNVKELEKPKKSEVRGYRRVKRNGTIINIALLKNGKTQATSIWKPKKSRRAR